MLDLYNISSIYIISCLHGIHTVRSQMDLLNFLILVSVSFFCQSLCVYSVPLTDNHTIECYLCNTRQQFDPVISLLSNTTYIVSPGRFCLVDNVTNLTIRGEDPSSPTIIKCLRNTSSFVARGFGFFEVDNLVIENIKFEDCGGILSHDVLKLSHDSTSFYFGSGSSAVLFCSHCTNISIENVIITNYTGYAVIGCNLFGLSHFNQLSVTNNMVDGEYANWTRNGTGKGSGILLLFKSMKSVKEGNVLISNSDFVRNKVRLPEPETLNCTDLVFEHFVSPADHPMSFPVITVSALTIVYSDHSFTASVNITNTWFVNNEGHCFGSVAVFFFNQLSSSSLDFSNCTFKNNSLSIEKFLHGGHSFFGTDVTMYMAFRKETTMVNCLSISDSNFYRNFNHKIRTLPSLAISQLPGSKGICQVNLSNLFSTSDSSFINAWNMELGGSTLHLEILDLSLVGSHSYPGGIVYEDSSAVNGIMEFLNVQSVKLSGTHSNSCVFDNLIGPVILATSSNLEFSGNIIFKNNNGFVWIDGATVSLQGNSYLFLREPTNVVFENNSAVVGGAIYSADMQVPFCVIQYFTDSYYTYKNITNMNVKLTFNHNSASVAGNSVYIGRLYDCSIQLSSPGVKLRSNELHYVYDSIFKFEKPLNNSLLEVSSTPYTACMCNESSDDSTLDLSCNEFDITVPTFPGKTLQFPMIAVDYDFKPVYSTSYIRLLIKGENTFFNVKSSWRLDYGQGVIQMFATDCRRYNFTIFSEEGPTVGKLIVFVGGSQKILSIAIDLQECPPGFDRSIKKDSCDCSKLLQKNHVTCDINTQRLFHPQFSWIGITNGYKNNETKRMGFSSHCPLRYCHPSVESILANDSSSLCLSNRTGILCGKCPTPLSTVIGGDGCRECSNWYLLTIPLFAFAGLVFVIIVFMLRLTVTRGTINGLLFYANIVYINRKLFIGKDELRWLQSFILTLNLRLGFPLCFYDTMSSLDSSYLAYIFPMYLLLIELVIVLMSRYTNRISHLIARSACPVLATLFHFLYNYVVVSSVDGLSFSELQFDDLNGTDQTRLVWYFDGNVDYLRGSHLSLFIIIILTIVFFLIPYTILLTGVNYFSKYRLVNYFRPLTDAYCAPYKDKWRFWFGARLWILIAINVIVAVRIEYTILFLSQSIILATFTFMQLAIAPFKDFMINILDSFFMINGLLLSILVLCSREYRYRIGVQIVSGILVGSAFIIFVGIVLYHVWDVTGRKNLWIYFKKVKRNSYKLIDNDREERENQEGGTSELVPESPPPTYQVLSYHPERLRESTLETNSNVV